MNALSRPREEPAGPPGEAAFRHEAAELGPARQLRGHSGATVLLYGRGRASFVRKTAGEKRCNERLRSQSALQRRLFSYGMPFPRVLSEGEDEAGLAFFDMEYVPANNLAALICEFTHFDRDAAVSALDKAFRFFRLTAQDALPAAPFHAKIDQITERCRTSQACGPKFAAIAKMAVRLNALRWDGVPSSLCHGDMTLENMIFSDTRGLVFIDCDDCFVSSYWLDAAKLFQDVAGHWCLRELYMSRESAPSVERAAQTLEKLAPPLRAMLALVDPQLVLRLPQFAALNLFRTLPYVKTERLTAFVLERMTHVLNCAKL